MNNIVWTKIANKREPIHATLEYVNASLTMDKYLYHIRAWPLWHRFVCLLGYFFWRGGGLEGVGVYVWFKFIHKRGCKQLSLFGNVKQIFTTRKFALS